MGEDPLFHNLIWQSCQSGQSLVFRTVLLFSLCRWTDHQGWIHGNAQTAKHSGLPQLKHSIKKMIMSKIAFIFLPEQINPALSSVQLRSQHNFVDEVDDGHSRLLRVHLCKQVTHVLCGAACPPRHKAEHPAGGRSPENLKQGKVLCQQVQTLIINCHAKSSTFSGADYMTLKRKNVHDASTYLLGVLSELIHLKHGCTDRGTETKETRIMKSWTEFLTDKPL